MVKLSSNDQLVFGQKFSFPPLLLNTINFFSFVSFKDFIYLFIYLFMRHRETEAGPRQGPEAGLDPEALGSRPGLQATLNREPPGLPTFFL